MKTIKLLIFLFSLVAVKSLAAQINHNAIGRFYYLCNHSGDTVLLV